MTTTRPKIDLVDPASFDGGQPHDAFAWLRANDPVHRHQRPEGHFWAITKHADVRAIGRDHRTFSNEAGGIHLNEIRPEGPRRRPADDAVPGPAEAPSLPAARP